MARIGGPTRYFVEVESEEDVREAIVFAKEKKLSIKVIGGGSNILFSDEGFDGVVLKNCMGKFDYSFEGDKCIVTADGGIVFDELVQWTIIKGLGGIECLSWIPGTVGAAPVQNVGAYGQQVSDVIKEVWVVELETGRMDILEKRECQFGYRDSIFKRDFYGKYMILRVVFEFRKFEGVRIDYKPLASYLFSHYEPWDIDLNTIRMAIFDLRMRKGMIPGVGECDFGTVGSFFINPEVNEDKLNYLKNRYDDVPNYSLGKGRYRIPAAWLIEKAGFSKGYRCGNVGISPYHALALISYGGTRKELMNLACRIQDAVWSNFGVRLEIEPDVVQE